MHVVLTDALTCPRCGPEYGLLLLAERVEARRVLEGSLACSNCRERYPVRGGTADVRFGELFDPAAEPAEPGTEALPLAALLGITEGPALMLLVGGTAVHARAIADMIPGVEVIAASTPPIAEPDAMGVSKVITGRTLPLRTGSMRGVALSAGATALLEEAARVLAPRARLVVLSGAGNIASQLTEHGLHVIARDEQVTVAQRAAF